MTPPAIPPTTRPSTPPSTGCATLGAAVVSSISGGAICAVAGALRPRGGGGSGVDEGFTSLLQETKHRKEKRIAERMSTTPSRAERICRFCMRFLRFVSLDTEVARNETRAQSQTPHPPSATSPLCGGEKDSRCSGCVPFEILAGLRQFSHHLLIESPSPRARGEGADRRMRGWGKTLPSPTRVMHSRLRPRHLHRLAHRRCARRLCARAGIDLAEVVHL